MKFPDSIQSIIELLIPDVIVKQQCYSKADNDYFNHGPTFEMTKFINNETMKVHFINENHLVLIQHGKLSIFKNIKDLNTTLSELLKPKEVPQNGN